MLLRVNVQTPNGSKTIDLRSNFCPRVGEAISLPPQVENVKRSMNRVTDVSHVFDEKLEEWCVAVETVPMNS